MTRRPQGSRRPGLRLCVVLSACLAVCACGTTSTAQMNVVPVAATSFTLVDERPPEQRRQGKVQSISGETTRFGDDSLSPPAPALVRTWLQNHLSSSLGGKEVVLKSFDASVYDPAVTVHEVPGTEGMFGVAGGALGRGMMSMFQSSSGHKYVNVNIELMVDGKTIQARKAGQFRGRVSEEDILGVVKSALDETVAQIRLNAAP
jgi:hypothetical protein